MKPTVINNSSASESNNVPLSQSPSSSNHPQQQQFHQPTSSPQQQYSQSQNREDLNNRRFPSFPHNFGFDDDDDIFADMGLRSRMNRMNHHHPFDWTMRKRRGSNEQQQSEPVNDPYEQYFHDDVDFPGFGSQWREPFNRTGSRKRTQHAQPEIPRETDRSGFFDYLPPEFRKYIPDSFAFPSMRHTPPQRSTHNIQYVSPQQQQQQQPPQQQQAQQQQTPQSPQRDNSKPKLCDAAIQTEDVTDGNNNNLNETRENNLNQHGLRNTVDLGQKSQPEEIKTDRSQSAPSIDAAAVIMEKDNINNNNNNSSSSIGENQSTNVTNTGTSMTPQLNVEHQKAFNYPQSQADPVKPSQTKRQQQQQQQQQPPPTETGMRNIPILVEGRDVPATSRNIPKNTNAGNKKQSVRVEPMVRKSESEMEEQQQQCDQQQAPPQTPYTSDCIEKIQLIQRDVLELMSRIEVFEGCRGDKDYIFLDEMLTRNLIKLDVIETDGRENVRLARKEAIKCIQASIAVLEAKADLNIKGSKQDTENPINSDKVEENVENIATELNKADIVQAKQEVLKDNVVSADTTPTVEQKSNNESTPIDDIKNVTDESSQKTDVTQSETSNSSTIDNSQVDVSSTTNEEADSKK